jgi:hypothetical protein
MMNSEQPTAVSALISKYGMEEKKNVWNNATLIECEKTLQLPDQLLRKIQRATDPMRGRGDMPNDFGEFEGMKSLNLWCLTEAYGYELSKMPDDPVAWIQDGYAAHNQRPELTKEHAAIICQFFITLNGSRSVLKNE